MRRSRAKFGATSKTRNLSATKASIRMALRVAPGNTVLEVSANATCLYASYVLLHEDFLLHNKIVIKNIIKI
jgi:hypothetical protein